VRRLDRNAATGMESAADKHGAPDEGRNEDIGMDRPIPCKIRRRESSVHAIGESACSSALAAVAALTDHASNGSTSQCSR
jgi:hypothetical protein